MGKRLNEKTASDAQQKRLKRYKPMGDRIRNQQNVFEISPGMKGFFVTCNRHKEKKSAMETIDLLEEYAAKLYPGLEDEIENEGADDKDDGGAQDEAGAGDIEDEIAREVAGMKSNTKQKLFRYLNTTIDCIVFIKCHRRIDPEQLVEYIFEDLTKTMQRKTRFTGRLIPAKVITTSKIDAIVKGAKDVAKDLLADDAEPSTFALVVNIRYCDGLKRDDVIPAVAAPLDEKHKVDLKHSKYTVVIEAFKSICVLGLLTDYTARKRYNLQTLFDEPPAVKDGEVVKPTESDSQNDAGSLEDDKTEDATSQAAE
ncbi:hypothetical protein LPJ73_001408 [Coemansia sp. RSA 2703]|nr:hypothetical protein LPJ73_001408 [Coemansia sp. RSA 2703]KAJ2376175.1 hypothetical protein IW150_002134 [Coemansia sp. RSA 2607]KAJ2395938.1 hypothetical protein GGI05_001359 [Coemansia sp. RSA 2603]